MDIDLTRAMVQAALTGQLKDVEYDQDPIFKVWIPRACPDCPMEILTPSRQWAQPEAYEERARKLAHEFHVHFEKSYGSKNIDKKIRDECPC